MNSKKIIGIFVAVVIVFIGAMIVGGLRVAMGAKDPASIPSLMISSILIVSLVCARIAYKRIQGVSKVEGKAKDTAALSSDRTVTNNKIKDLVVERIVRQDTPDHTSCDSENVKLNEDFIYVEPLYSEDQFFEQALTEYQDGSYHKATYAKAVVKANGDENKLMAAYIENRASRLIADYNRKILSAVEKECTKCNRLLNSDEVICSVCESENSLVALNRHESNLSDKEKKLKIESRLNNGGISVGSLVFYSIEEVTREVTNLKHKIKRIERGVMSGKDVNGRLVQNSRSYDEVVADCQLKINEYKNIIGEIKNVFYPFV